MIKVIKSDERHRADFGWLQTRWHFSFDQYYDPSNIHWGALRVFNDDVIQPGKGFGRHPHRDMEIVTYVLEGELEHQDSTGNRGVIRAGQVQVMSAGTGIQHSESNHSKEKLVHLLQLWILPRTEGAKPRWEQREFPRAARRGKLLPVVSSGDLAGTLAIDQDAEIYVSALGQGEKLRHTSRAERKVYIFVIGGRITLNGQALAAGDQARVGDERELRIEAAENSELIFLDLPEIT
jgi:quercetin 2,3-dioxygenase